MDQRSSWCGHFSIKQIDFKRKLIKKEGTDTTYCRKEKKSTNITLQFLTSMIQNKGSNFFKRQCLPPASMPPALTITN